MKSIKKPMLFLLVLSVLEFVVGYQYWQSNDVIYKNFYMSLVVVGLLLLLKIATNYKGLNTNKNEEN